MNADKFEFTVFDVACGSSPDIDAFKVVNFTATETMSKPFLVELTLGVNTDDDLFAFDDVLGSQALLAILDENDQAERYFHGIISQFWQVDSHHSSRTNQVYCVYKAHLVPAVWRLSLRKDCRIFHYSASTEQCVKKIVSDILTTNGGLPTDAFAFRPATVGGVVAGEPRTHCVQYRETDLNFMSRLLEEEGIFHFFEHSAGGHTMVFADAPASYGELQDENQVCLAVPYYPPRGLQPPGDSVNAFQRSQQIRPDKVTLNEFSLANANLDLKRSHSATTPTLEMYDYPGKFATQTRGDSLAALRWQQAQAQRILAAGASDCSRFTAGFVFELTNPEGFEGRGFNETYLLTTVIHSGSDPQALEGGAAQIVYTNTFEAIPAVTTFRPQSDTPKPRIDGIQTATVVGASDAAETTPLGQVKVKFHWDRSSPTAGSNSCWVPVGHAWAGPVPDPSGTKTIHRGAMHVPLEDDEVIISFLEGDPDRPIIIGSVYHTLNPPSKVEAVRNKTIQRDQAGNELVFDAAPGKVSTKTSNWGKESKFTHDDKAEANLGNTLEVAIGSKHEVFVGNALEVALSEAFSLGAGLTYEAFLGGKSEFGAGYAMEFFLGPKVELHKGNMIEKADDIKMVAADDAILSAKDKLILVGGAGDKTNTSTIIRGSDDTLTLTVGIDKNPDGTDADKLKAAKNIVVTTYLLTTFISGLAAVGTTASTSVLDAADAEDGWQASELNAWIPLGIMQALTMAANVGILIPFLTMIENEVHEVEHEEDKDEIRGLIKIDKEAGIRLAIEPKKKTSRIEMKKDGSIDIESKEKPITIKSTAQKIDIGSEKESVLIASEKKNIELNAEKDIKINAAQKNMTISMDSSAIMLRKKSGPSFWLSGGGAILKNPSGSVIVKSKAFIANKNLTVLE